MVSQPPNTQSTTQPCPVLLWMGMRGARLALGSALAEEKKGQRQRCCFISSWQQPQEVRQVPKGIPGTQGHFCVQLFPCPTCCPPHVFLLCPIPLIHILGSTAHGERKGVGQSGSGDSFGALSSHHREERMELCLPSTPLPRTKCCAPAELTVCQ